MSIETQLEELNHIKTNIFTSISNKGVIVPENPGLKDAAVLIDSITTGGEIPIPSDIKLYENLRSSVSTYQQNDKKIYVDLSNFDNGDSKKIGVIFTTHDMVYQNMCYLYSNENEKIHNRYAYNYTDTTYYEWENGGSNQFKAVGLSFANSRQCVIMQNGKMILGFTGQIKYDVPDAYSNQSIGTMSFPGNYGGNCIIYHKFFIDTNDDKRLVELVPAEKNSIPGFYDTKSGNFYTAVDNSDWSVDTQIL